MGARLVEAERLAGKALLRSVLVLLLGCSSDVSLNPLLSWQVEDLDTVLGGNDEPEDSW